MPLLQKGGWTNKSGSRELNIYSGDQVLTLIMDPPPQDLHNRWTKERVEYYKRFEPNEPRRNEAPIRPEGGTRRICLEGEESNMVWTAIMTGNSEQVISEFDTVMKDLADKNKL